MKNTIKLLTLGVMAFNISLSASILPDRGGKFGSKQQKIIENTISIPKTTGDISKRGCGTITTSAYIHQRHWDYWIGGKIEGYATTTTTECGVPYQSTSMRIRMTLGHIGTFADGTSYNTDYKKVSGYYYWYSSNPGEYMHSYHTTNLGFTTVNQHLYLSW